MRKIQIMGIVNVTPDSFYSDSRSFRFEKAYAHARKQVEEGADILDIGGESTRPTAMPVSEEEELARVLPVIHACVKEWDVPVSIDTYKMGVARAATVAGARLVNDIRGGEDDEMCRLVADTDVDYVIMHMQGTPQTMQQAPHYPNGVVKTVMDWFKERVEKLLRFGIKQSNIILDPGIGFGKTAMHNFEILRALPLFRTLGCRLLVGISRKSFLGAHSGRPPEKRLPETLAMHTLLMKEMRDVLDIVRVHDVEEHVAIRAFLEHLVEVEHTLTPLNGGVT